MANNVLNPLQQKPLETLNGSTITSVQPASNKNPTKNLSNSKFGKLCEGTTKELQDVYDTLTKLSILKQKKIDLSSCFSFLTWSTSF